MSIYRDFEDEFLSKLGAALGVPYVHLMPAPTREDTIKEAWRLAGDRFDYQLGHLTVVHDLDIVEPIRFEAVQYGNVMAVEAEGLIVSRIPIVSFRRED
jgi:hypothetical protein